MLDDAGASASESEGGEGETKSSSDSVGTDTETDTDTGVPPCDPQLCVVDCSWRSDECGQGLVPGCTDMGECACVQPQPCPPCDDVDCGRWEHCSGPGSGWCTFGCSGSGPLWLDPPDGCEVPTPGFDSQLANLTEIDLDGQTYSYDDDCSQDANRWVWLVPGELLLLCPELCLVFPQAESALLTWNVPCE